MPFPKTLVLYNLPDGFGAQPVGLLNGQNGRLQSERGDRRTSAPRAPQKNEPLMKFNVEMSWNDAKPATELFMIRYFNGVPVLSLHPKECFLISIAQLMRCAIRFWHYASVRVG